MVLQQRLSLKLAQRLVMTPALQQAIKLLQMTRLELEGVLNQEIVENPMLEDGEDEDPEEGPSAEAAGATDGDAPAAPADETEKLNGAEEGAAVDNPDPGDPEEPSMGDIDLDAYFNDYLGPDSTVANTFESREFWPIENKRQSGAGSLRPSALAVAHVRRTAASSRGRRVDHRQSR